MDSIALAGKLEVRIETLLDLLFLWFLQQHGESIWLSVRISTRQPVNACAWVEQVDFVTKIGTLEIHIYATEGL